MILSDKVFDTRMVSLPSSAPCRFATGPFVRPLGISHANRNTKTPTEHFLRLPDLPLVRSGFTTIASCPSLGGQP